MIACWRVTPSLSNEYRRGFCWDQQTVSNGLIQYKKKVLVVGSGWAGLGAAHHLSKQGPPSSLLRGLDVTVLEGGYDSGTNRLINSPDDFGIKREFILQVEFPIFQDLPQWLTPSGTLFYTQFIRLPLVDRLTSLPLMAAVVDFDNTDTSWRKYDTSQIKRLHSAVTVRELFRQFGCPERLYEDVFNPLLQVGLFAPAERCSAAATLGMLYYILAHQVKEKNFEPWMESRAAKVVNFWRAEDRNLHSAGNNSEQKVCLILPNANDVGDRVYQNEQSGFTSAALCTREGFLKVMNLATVDLLTVKLQLDRKVKIPNAINACSGFYDSNGWTFFDLSSIHDEHKDDSVTFVQADFFYANELLPLKDDNVAAKAMSYLSKCVKNFDRATVIDKEIGRFPKFLTHFSQKGSYKYVMRGCTSFPNLFMAGDWIITRHGAWSQEKSFVTGLEAANRVVDYVEEGSFARIIPVEEDEPHIQALRSLNRNLNDMIAQLPWSDYFIR
ncbi:Lysine-specific histone demethylase [Actinidia chinensis var. chinensis]|uniref:Lysine-specific histone demethylase n=1 Tax=Actinidia chinensis var. chinensis TaxID=1590841 RepID=A0A2R6R6Z6_ACTCC|nr:Lysine-specific histone demethylase [Actinidia chinensis var. chinensis]